MKEREIDWSKAPEWATGYGNSPGGPVWFSDDSYTYVDGGQEGRVFSIIRGEGWCLEEIRTVSSRPSFWNGTGLPPVGALCEYLDSSGSQWHRATVMYSGEDLMVLRGATRDGEEVEIPKFKYEGPQFRPIRTPEQIAAEGREKEVDAIEKIIGAAANLGKSAATAIYDAGYRKVEGEKK